MKMIWNKELKRLAGAFLLCALLSILGMHLCVAAYGRDMRKEYHHLLAAVFGNVAAAYPEVAQEELVRVLNGRENEAAGADILKRYGMLEAYAEESFAGQERRLLLFGISADFFMLLFFCAVGIWLYAYFRRQQNKIRELTDYMEALNRSGYRMEVEDNADDELSGLRNELYKLTVFLKEQAERALEQKRMLADAMADISHQLKTPLTSATVLLDNLAENADMDSAVRQRFLTEITRQVTSMSWLVTAMLKLSRLDAGMVEFKGGWIAGETLVGEVLQRLEIAAEWKGVTFSVDFPEEMRLFADRKWTEEALLNVVKNAVEHSYENGVVEICGEENEVYRQISVRDHGPGIGEEARRNLFRRFYRGNAIREDSVGIGLALSKEIVERQGGFLSVDACRDGGTVFLFRFLRQEEGR